MFPYTCFTTLIAPVGICLRAWIILIYTRRCKWQFDSGWSVVWIWCLVEHVITSILFCRQHVNLDTKLYEVTGLKNLSPQIIRIYLNHQAPAFILVKKKKWFLETAFKGWMILPAVNCMNNCRILYKEWVEKRVIDSLVSDRFSEARWEGSCSCQSRLLSTQRHAHSYTHKLVFQVPNIHTLNTKMTWPTDEKFSQGVHNFDLKPYFLLGTQITLKYGNHFPGLFFVHNTLLNPGMDWRPN